MPLATGKAAFKTALKNAMEAAAANTDPEKTTTQDDYVNALADALEVWIKTASVTVPGLGLVAPGGPVTGTSVTGELG